MVNLGLLYYEGKGVAVDLKKAFELYKLSAEQNDYYAQKLLAERVSG